MLSMETNRFQDIAARRSVEHELAAAGEHRGGAVKAHRRHPPELRHRSQRGECSRVRRHCPGPAGRSHPLRGIKYHHRMFDCLLFY